MTLLVEQLADPTILGTLDGTVGYIAPRRWNTARPPDVFVRPLGQQDEYGCRVAWVPPI